jgi:hypothetical protein
MRLRDAQVQQGLRGFEAQQPSSQYRAGLDPGGVCLDPIQVFDGPVNKHPFFFYTGDVGNKGGRAGGQYEMVIMLGGALIGMNQLLLPVYLPDLMTEMKNYLLVFKPSGHGEREIRGGFPIKIFTKMYPVVSGAGFLAKDDNLELTGNFKLFAEPVSNHAIPDNDHYGEMPIAHNQSFLRVKWQAIEIYCN